MELTEDDFLGGLVRAFQPKAGFRAGLDTVMMAAAVPARKGEAVLELGSGNGVAGLCLAARTGAVVTGIEREPDMAALATKNAAHNGQSTQFICAAIEALPAEIKQARFDHVMANPPFQDPAEGQSPPDPGKRAAHMADTPLEIWVQAASQRVKEGGTVTLVHRADRMGELLSLFEGRLGAIVVFPLWPRAGEAAKRVIIQGTKGSKAPLVLSAGLVLHGQDHTFTPEAAQVLRQAGPLTLRPANR